MLYRQEAVARGRTVPSISEGHAMQQCDKPAELGKECGSSEATVTDRQICALIARDCEYDASTLDGMVVTGRALGKKFGGILGMVFSLAEVLERTIARIEAIEAKAESQVQP